jgi:threonine dehydratase
MLQLSDIQEASRRIASGIIRSPCPPSVPLSLATGMEIYCKLEYLQRTGSFKERGARNALLQLSPADRRRGVVAASAGNHALGLAWHGQLLEIPVTVVMPRHAPWIKVKSCQEMNARVILEGGNIEESRAHARRLSETEGLRPIHGFDDLEVIAGQGTLALEILEQVPEVEAVVVPIGGGGLIAGMAVALKAHKPEILVIGVQPEAVASYEAASRKGEPATVRMQPTLADGLAVPRAGDQAFALAAPRVNRHVLVSEESIALAVLRLVELEKAVVEGAGAVPLAACLSGLLPELAGKKVVLPLCGGNIDTNILGRIIERGLAADGRLCRFSAMISDHPGGLAHFAQVVASERGNILDIFHDRTFSRTNLTQVAVQCVVETRDHQHIQILRERLLREGFSVAFPGDQGPGSTGV